MWLCPISLYPQQNMVFQCWPNVGLSTHGIQEKIQTQRYPFCKKWGRQYNSRPQRNSSDCETLIFPMHVSETPLLGQIIVICVDVVGYIQTPLCAKQSLDKFEWKQWLCGCEFVWRCCGGQGSMRERGCLLYQKQNTETHIQMKRESETMVKRKKVASWCFLYQLIPPHISPTWELKGRQTKLSVENR